MRSKRKSFCVVCIANYCRSPVFENILRDKYKDTYEFFSCGLSPIFEPSMDKRSIAFLESLNVKSKLHTPKRINKRILNYFDFFITVDFYVLNELNKLFPKYKNKFKLASSQFEGKDIIDPFRLDDEQYEKVMRDIQFISNKINLENL